MTDLSEPSGEVMDQAAAIIFTDLDKSKDGKISVFEFKQNSVVQPVLASWLKAFSTMEAPRTVPVITTVDPDISGVLQYFIFVL